VFGNVTGGVARRDTESVVTSWLEDPDAVAEEYASEEAFRQRTLAFSELLDGLDEEELVRTRILAARPRRLLDVGSGLGDLCAWAQEQLDGEVVAVDSSPRMVELAARAGITAVRADMRQLPFAAASFDCVVACAVLYHVPDPETAIAEAARVLDAEGLLLATTGSDDALERDRAWGMLFAEEIPAQPPLSFSRENGRDLLLRYFRHVEQVDCDGALVFPTRERLVRYVQALPLARDAAGRVPELSEPFRLPVKMSVFQATTPR
jgi:SAM-dependent methyltransferase